MLQNRKTHNLLIFSLTHTHWRWCRCSLNMRRMKRQSVCRAVWEGKPLRSCLRPTLGQVEKSPTPGHKTWSSLFRRNSTRLSSPTVPKLQPYRTVSCFANPSSPHEQTRTHYGQLSISLHCFSERTLDTPHAHGPNSSQLPSSPTKQLFTTPC